MMGAREFTGIQNTVKKRKLPGILSPMDFSSFIIPYLALANLDFDSVFLIC
jgi:hypothetical protein